MRTKKSNPSRSDAVTIFKCADAEWERGHNKRAFELFLEAAQLGQPSAQHNVGYFYDVGIGIRKDTDKALFWYKKAWKCDRQTGTCINIAKVYASRMNSRGALLWWRKAISLGDGDAALDLAKFYLSKGQGRKDQVIDLLRQVRTSRHVTQAAIEEATSLLDTLV